MDFTIHINCDGSALQDDMGYELSRILALLATKFETGSAGDSGKLKDINGNTVGVYHFSE